MSLPDKTISQYVPHSARPDLSADYLIEHIRFFSFEARVLMSRFDLDTLATSIMRLMERGANPAYLQDLNNRAVYIIRSYIETLKADGVFCIQARRGLRVPVMLELHYEVIYETNYPALISGVMQNAFFGNPTTGETKPWRSPKGRLVR